MRVYQCMNVKEALASILASILHDLNTETMHGAPFWNQPNINCLFRMELCHSQLIVWPQPWPLTSMTSNFRNTASDTFLKSVWPDRPVQF